MTLPSSGLIRLSDIQGEFGGTNPIPLSEYYRGGPRVNAGSAATQTIPASGTIRMSNFYGTSAIRPRSLVNLLNTNATSGTQNFAGAPDPYRWLIAIQAAFNGQPIGVSAAPIINGTSMTIIARERSDAYDDGHVTGIFGLNVPTGDSFTWSRNNAGPSDAFAFFEVTGIADLFANDITSNTSSITVSALPAFCVGCFVANFADNGGISAVNNMSILRYQAVDQSGAACVAWDQDMSATSLTYGVTSGRPLVLQTKAAFRFDW